MALSAPPQDLVAQWSARDEDHALLPIDRELVAATSSARALIVERIVDGDIGPDLFNACAVYGYLLGKDGGSPTLAASTSDGLSAVVGTSPATWLEAAKAAIVEGYVAARLDSAALEAKRHWEYPRCAVRLDETTAAIVAGYPDADGEEVADWAARVARAAASNGVRRARVGGERGPALALIEALSFLGIAVFDGPRPRGASWLPWRRRE